jgi:hypothetical protein
VLVPQVPHVGVGAGVRLDHGAGGVAGTVVGDEDLQLLGRIRLCRQAREVPPQMLRPFVGEHDDR